MRLPRRKGTAVCEKLVRAMTPAAEARTALSRLETSLQTSEARLLISKSSAPKPLGFRDLWSMRRGVLGGGTPVAARWVQPSPQFPRVLLGAQGLCSLPRFDAGGGLLLQLTRTAAFQVRQEPRPQAPCSARRCWRYAWPLS